MNNGYKIRSHKEISDALMMLRKYRAQFYREEFEFIKYNGITEETSVWAYDNAIEIFEWILGHETYFNWMIGKDTPKKDLI